MTKFINNISQFVETQFPEWMREQGQELTTSNRAVLIDFVEAYYEWLEENYEDNSMLNREMQTIDDVDTTMDEYIKHFREKYLKDFPYVAATDDQFLIKNVIDFYRTKGSPRSIKLLIRFLFNQDADIYLPGQDIFRLSHSKWYEPKYLEVLHEDGTFDLTNKQIVGSKSKAKAFVEGIVTKRINGVFIDVIYISDIKGEFLTGDRVVSVESGDVLASPLVVGSLSSITTTDNSVSGVSVGDIYDVVSSRGKQGKAKVTETYSFGRSTEVEIEDGGFGYTLDDMTELYVSDNILYANTVPATFNDRETLTQKIETVVIGNSAYGTFESIANGESFAAFDEANNETANGSLVLVNPHTADDANTTLHLQVDAGTIVPTVDITLDFDTIFAVDEIVEEGDEVSITLDSSNGSFGVNDIVYQKDLGISSADEFTVGTIVSANSTVLRIKDVFGTFNPSLTIRSYRSTDAEAEFNTSDDIEYHYEGGTGTVLSVESNTGISVATANTSKFQTGREVRGVTSTANSFVTNTSVTSATTIVIDSTSYDIEVTANAYYTGVLVESSNSIMKIASQSGDFIMMDNVSELHGTGNSVIITDAALGSDFNFEIGSLENTEEVYMTTMRFSDTNIAGVRLADMTFDSLNSSVYRVTAINVAGGGTGYSNGDTITVIGGGVSNNTPYIPARGIITASGGVITSIEMVDNGEAYISETLGSIVSTGGGSGATFTYTTETGYGFEHSLYEDETSTIGDAFGFELRTLGTIKNLSNVNLGSNYTITPCVYIENPYVSDSQRYDNILVVELTSKSFKIGEVVEQSLTGAKGLVQSYNTITKRLSIRVITFEADFLAGNAITGATTGATANVNTVLNNTADPIMGLNADIGISIVSADGVVKSLKIINSGYGYVDDETVTLTKDGESLTATAYVEKQGKAEGYWRTFDSHPSDTKKLHDNYYYQEYSYDIKTPVPLNKYKQQIKDILHVAGTEFFGSVSKQTEKTLTLTSETAISVA